MPHKLNSPAQTKLVLLSVIALLTLIVSAYISITLPISEKGIPFTAQSLVVFVIAGLFKPGHTAAIIGSYLLLGLVGLPVFAEGTAGWEKLAGASGGFLYGFLIAGVVISLLTKTVESEKSGVLMAMLIGTVVLFIFGLGQLCYKFGWSKALEYGFYPFWKMALVKALLAALVVVGAKRALKKAD